MEGYKKGICFKIKKLESSSKKRKEIKPIFLDQQSSKTVTQFQIIKSVVLKYNKIQSK